MEYEAIVKLIVWISFFTWMILGFIIISKNMQKTTERYSKGDLVKDDLSLFNWAIFLFMIGNVPILITIFNFFV